MSRGVLLIALVVAAVAVAGVTGMTEEEAEGVMSGRIKVWPPEPAAAGEQEPVVHIGFGSQATCGCGQAATISNEGSRACCYYDSVGVPTIGVGHNINANPNALTKYGLNPTTVKNTCGQYTSYKAGYCLNPAQINDV